MPRPTRRAGLWEKRAALAANRISAENLYDAAVLAIRLAERRAADVKHRHTVRAALVAASICIGRLLDFT